MPGQSGAEMNAHHDARNRAIQACPEVDRRGHRAYMAVLDAQDLVMAVRDLDPREVWGTLAGWLEQDPLRVLAAVTAVAAMVQRDRPGRELCAWTEDIGRAPGAREGA